MGVSGEMLRGKGQPGKPLTGLRPLGTALLNGSIICGSNLFVFIKLLLCDALDTKGVMNEHRPNVLLITTDQQRYDAMGINGNPHIRTPNMDALAASGTNFSRCYVTCPVCIPARRTLLSGLHPDTHGLPGYQDGCDFDPAHTMPGCFRQAGYQTQLVGKLHLHPQRKRYGYDHMVLSDSANHRPESRAQKQNDYTTFIAEQGMPTTGSAHGINGNGRVARPFHLDEMYHQTTWLSRMAMRFMREWRDPSCPFFLHLSFTAPHPPLTPPQVYFDQYINNPDLAPTLGQWAPGGSPKPGLSPDAPAGPFDPGEIHDAIAGYYGLISHIDDQINDVIGQFFEYATERLKEPMIIAFSSDHGEMLGDHHMFRKSQSYESSAHVPFFITGRNYEIPKGRCDAMVTWEDIMPTLLDLAGLPLPDGLDGRSLAPVMRGEAEQVRDHIDGGCTGFATNQYIVDEQYKYVWFAHTGEEQLFDLQNDPRELCDLSGTGQIDLTPYRQIMAARCARTDSLPDYDMDTLSPCNNRPPKAIWPI